MNIWELTPLDPSDHNWRASTHSDRVVVRAETEERARHLASLAFGIAADMVPGAEVPLLPWHYDWLVAVQPVTSDKYDPDGEETILDPADADDLWRS